MHNDSGGHPSLSITSNEYLGPAPSTCKLRLPSPAPTHFADRYPRLWSGSGTLANNKAALRVPLVSREMFFYATPLYSRCTFWKIRFLENIQSLHVVQRGYRKMIEFPSARTMHCHPKDKPSSFHQIFQSGLVLRQCRADETRFLIFKFARLGTKSSVVGNLRGYDLLLASRAKRVSVISEDLSTILSHA